MEPPDDRALLGPNDPYPVVKAARQPTPYQAALRRHLSYTKPPLRAQAAKSFELGWEIGSRDSQAYVRELLARLDRATLEKEGLRGEIGVLISEIGRLRDKLPPSEWGVTGIG